MLIHVICLILKFVVFVSVVLALVVVVKLRRSNRSKKTHGKLVYQANCLCLFLWGGDGDGRGGMKFEMAGWEVVVEVVMEDRWVGWSHYGEVQQDNDIPNCTV